jgi:acyl-CoA thioester hydrolase
MAMRAARSATRREASGLRLHETRVELDVPFHHVDALGIVWHGHYPKYFEAAGMALLRKLALDGGDLIGDRHRLVVIETACRHAFPLRYADRVAVTAWISEYARRLVIRYDVRNLSHDRRAAHGHTVIATLDAEGRLRLETPREIIARIQA